MSVGHAGLEGVVVAGSGDSGVDIMLVDWEPVESGFKDVESVESEPVESGTEDTVVVSVVGVGISGPRLLTLVKIKGLAYRKQKSTISLMHKLINAS